MRKIKILICPIMIFAFLFIVGHTAFAKELSASVYTNDNFEYEYSGQILMYKVTSLPKDSNHGIVALIGAKDKVNLSGEVQIPANVSYMGEEYSVTSIDHDAFNGSRNITSVTIPEGVKNIGWNAFYQCQSLTDITIADSVTGIGDAAFLLCTSLKKIRLPKDLKVIPDNLFFKCSALESVEIPEGLKTIRRDSFKYCDNLKNIYLPKSITSIYSGTFVGKDVVCSVIRDSYAADYCKRNRLFCSYFAASQEAEIALEDIVSQEMETRLFSGQTQTLHILYYPMNTSENKTAVWTSKNHNVATVDANGVVTAVSPGKTKITAVIGSKQAEYIIIVNPYTPKSVKATATGLRSIRLTWNSVKGVRGYTIYRATSDKGPFARLTSIVNNYYRDISFYEDTALNPKTTYYYKVFAYDYGSSHFSKVATASPKLAQPKVSATGVKNDKIKLRWEYVTGSKGYIIYRSTSKNGTYKKYKTVTSLNYTDNDVSKNKTYYYYVKAYYTENNKNIYSDNSKTVKTVAKTPSTPKYVTIGTSLSDVYKILGKTHDKEYANGYLELLYTKPIYYFPGMRSAHIYLQKIDDEYIVIGWSNLYYSGYNAKVSDGYEQNTGSFTLGSTLNEVEKAMETPDDFELKFAGGISYGPHLSDFVVIKKSEIKYRDGSTITFNSDGKVVGWVNKGSLKLRNSSVKPTKAGITRGSSLNEVMKALGNPTKILDGGAGYPRYVTYGNSTLVFDHNLLLVQWQNRGKINISIGKKVPNAPEVKVGSSLDAVINALGTPDSFIADEIDIDSLREVAYGNYRIKFNSNQSVTGTYLYDGYSENPVSSIH